MLNNSRFKSDKTSKTKIFQEFSLHPTEGRGEEGGGLQQLPLPDPPAPLIHLTLGVPTTTQI